MACGEDGERKVGDIIDLFVRFNNSNLRKGLELVWVRDTNEQEIYYDSYDFS